MPSKTPVDILIERIQLNHLEKLGAQAKTATQVAERQRFYDEQWAEAEKTLDRELGKLATAFAKEGVKLTVIGACRTLSWRGSDFECHVNRERNYLSISSRRPGFDFREKLLFNDQLQLVRDASQVEPVEVGGVLAESVARFLQGI